MSTEGAVRSDVFDEERVEILDVVPFESASPSIWSCTRCAWHHPATESWSVRVRNRTQHAERSLVVCPSCAEDLRARTTGS